MGDPEVGGGGEVEAELWKNLDVQLLLLNSDNKQQRKATLAGLLHHVKTLSSLTDQVQRGPRRRKGIGGRDSDDDESDEDDGGHVEISRQETSGGPEGGILELVKPVLKHLSDPMEKCRELSYEILSTLFDKLPRQNVLHFLPNTIPILLNRLGSVELVEPSEEVRLLGVDLMRRIVYKVEKGLAPFVDDWIHILAATLTDPYHEVRKATCEVISLTAKIIPHVFHYNSERLNKPLCLTVGHQQSKVRLAAVYCIGDILLFGNHKCIDDFIPHLTHRLFDSQPNVRKAVIEVVGSWMMDYVDRYSFFHKMLPIIMTGLCDESDAVSETAYSLWEKIGDKYLEENIEEYKDQVDFPAEMPSDYPDHVKRPNFGCRLLTERNIGKIIPGVANDITDWVEATRQKCAQLLFHLILNAEEHITMYAEQLVHCMLKACMDSNPIVSDYVLKSARLLGYFVPFSTIWTILSARLQSSPSKNVLAVSASVIQGGRRDVMTDHLAEISSVLASGEICQTLNSEKQFWILQICEALMDNIPPSAAMAVENEEKTQKIPPEQDEVETKQNLFKVLLTVLAASAMTKDVETQARALVGLNHLMQICGLTSLDDLFIAYAGRIVENIVRSDIVWTPSTPEALIFVAILTHGGAAVEYYLSTILEILVKQLDTKKDPEVRLSLFSNLSDILHAYSQTSIKETCQMDKLQLFMTTIVDDILSPNLNWRAGRTASALRAAAMACLLTILDEKLLSVENYERVSEKCVSNCLAMLEDGYIVNRLLSTQCLGRLVEACAKKLRPDVTHKIYPELLKRLDDEKDEVRVSAGVAISKVFANVCSGYDIHFFKVHLEFAIDALLVHLDDEDENVQAAVAEALKALGSLDSSLLIQKCENFKHKQRSPVFCDSLIQLYQNMNISS